MQRTFSCTLPAPWSASSCGCGTSRQRRPGCRAQWALVGSSNSSPSGAGPYRRCSTATAHSLASRHRCGGHQLYLRDHVCYNEFAVRFAVRRKNTIRITAAATAVTATRRPRAEQRLVAQHGRVVRRHLLRRLLPRHDGHGAVLGAALHHRWPCRALQRPARVARLRRARAQLHPGVGGRGGGAAEDVQPTRTHHVRGLCRVLLRIHLCMQARLLYAFSWLDLSVSA